MKMKLLQSLAVIASLTSLTLAATASADHDHSHPHSHAKGKAGPRGGKLITEVTPHAEFFVNKEKKVEIRFVDKENKIVPPANQVVSIIMGDRSKPTRLSFSKDGDKLVSDKAIPAGNKLPTVIQIKSDASTKTVTEKFNLDLSQCGECDHAEYACVCSHGDEAGHKH